MPDTIITITLLISFFSLAIAILGHKDNQKQIKILLKRDRERDDTRDVLKELKSTSDMLKELPDYIHILLDSIILDIAREVGKKGSLDLIIKFKKFDAVGTTYAIDSINTPLLRTISREYLNCWQNHKQAYGCYLNFKAQPNVISDNWFEIGDFIAGLSQIEDHLEKLDYFEYIIDSFDADILKHMKSTYEEILKLFSDILDQEVYNIKFETTEPSEIECEINNILRYKQIYDKTYYLSNDIAYKIDTLRKELAKQVLI